MARIKYYYDTETCRYERIKTSTWDVVMNAAGLLFLCTIIGFGFAYLRTIFFPSQVELALMKENKELEYHYELLNKEVTNLKDIAVSLQDRDDNIYRVVFESEPIAKEIRTAGTGGTQKYKDLLDQTLDREDLIISTLQKIDLLKRQMYIQTKSYDEIAKLAYDKQALLKGIPAIQPVPNEDLKRIASGYGYRMHPILKVRKFHAGMDFSAPKGSPVYATADGKVLKAKYNGAYGKFIEIDHGFGYKTRYGHLNSFDIKAGAKVKRGQKIGEVGSTGRSTAPHLHYEVVHNKKHVNPVNFFYNDLSPEQYEEVLRISSIENQSLE